MYASKRTIGKQGVWVNAPVSKTEGKQIKHGNSSNKRGKQYYCQVVKDKHGFVVRTIWHLTHIDPLQPDMNAFALKRKKARLRKSMEKQPR